jgi:hypothetical protein
MDLIPTTDTVQLPVDQLYPLALSNATGVDWASAVFAEESGGGKGTVASSVHLPILHSLSATSLCGNTAE